MSEAPVVLSAESEAKIHGLARATYVGASASLAAYAALRSHIFALEQRLAALEADRARLDKLQPFGAKGVHMYGDPKNVNYWIWSVMSITSSLRTAIDDIVTIPGSAAPEHPIGERK